MSEQRAVREAKNSLFLKQMRLLTRNSSYFLPLQSAVIGCETVYASTPVRADNFNILFIFAIQGLSDFFWKDFTASGSIVYFLTIAGQSKTFALEAGKIQHSDFAERLEYTQKILFQIMHK